MAEVIYNSKYKQNLIYQSFKNDNWTNQEKQRNQSLVELNMAYRICHIDPGRIGYILVRRKNKRPLLYDNMDNVIRAQEHIINNCSLETNHNDFNGIATRTCSLARARYEFLLKEEKILLEQIKAAVRRLNLLHKHIKSINTLHNEWLNDQITILDTGLRIFAPSPFIDDVYSCSAKWQLAKKAIEKNDFKKAKTLIKESMIKVKGYKYLEPRIT